MLPQGRKQTMLRVYAWRRAPGAEAETLLAAVNEQVRPSPLEAKAVQIWSTPLPFYAETDLLKIVDQTRGVPNCRYALIADGQAVVFDHSNVPIYAHNARVGVEVDPDNAAAYATFFFDHVGGKQGRFRIVESGKDLAWNPDADPAAIAAAALEVRRVLFRGVEKGVILLTATVVFKTSLFRSDICVWADGRVEMRDTELLVERLPVRPDCTPGSDPFHLASEGQLY
jgi:hypothetical protein